MKCDLHFRPPRQSDYHPVERPEIQGHVEQGAGNLANGQN